MQTTARMPWIRAASATPCAWLPADEQTTPRFFCSSDISANLLSGPRILYDADALEHLGLEAHLVAGRFAQLARGEQRRVLDMRRDASPRLFEVAKGQREHVSRRVRE